MKQLLYFFLLIVTSFAIADDTPSSYQQAPAWLTDTRKAIESKDFDTARRILNENSEQKNSADWNNLMGFTLRKNHLLIWSNQKNTIKLHFKLIPNTKVHLSITVNFCCLKMIWQVQNQCSSALIKFVLSAVKNTEISRKVSKPSNLKNKLYGLLRFLYLP